MKEPKWWLDTESLQGGDFAMSTAFSALMRKVFIWMALALVITGVTAYGVATTPSLLIAIVTNKALFWGLIIAELALVFAVSGAINRLSLATATLLFVLYSVVNGATLSVIFLAYSMPAIIQTFFITAGTFGVMALVGYTTKTDLTSLGKLLFMALIGLVIATVVNMFVGSTGFRLYPELRRCTHLRRTHRLRHAEDQADVYAGTRCRRAYAEARSAWCVEPLPRLHQPLPLSAPYLRKQ